MKKDKWMYKMIEPPPVFYKKTKTDCDICGKITGCYERIINYEDFLICPECLSQIQENKSLLIRLFKRKLKKLTCRKKKNNVKYDHSGLGNSE